MTWTPRVIDGGFSGHRRRLERVRRVAEESPSSTDVLVLAVVAFFVVDALVFLGVFLSASGLGCGQ